MPPSCVPLDKTQGVGAVETQTDKDHHLLRKVAKGEQSALQALYTRHGGSILNYLDGLLQDKRLAEEVLQDVMFAVWEKASNFRGESKVRTWLFSIARNRAINALQGHQLKIVPFNPELANSSSDNLAQFELSEALEQAFEGLPSRQREVLEMKFYHGLKMAEIAEVLDIPLGTVQSRLHHAKQQLRRLLEKEGIDHA